MQEQNTFLLAETALQRVVDQIRDDQWAMVMPPSFATAADSPITLREVIHSLTSAYCLSGSAHHSGRDRC